MSAEAEVVVRVQQHCPHCEEDTVRDIPQKQAIELANLLLAAAAPQPILPLDRPVRVRGGCDA